MNRPVVVIAIAAVLSALFIAMGLPILRKQVAARFGNTAIHVPVQTPADTYLYLLPKQYLGDLRNLQGGAMAWQGYSANLRFEADDEVINAIIATGYQAADPADTVRSMQGSGTYGNFSPPWNPGAINDPECYVLTGQTGWSHDGTHYLVVDRANGVVYFEGGGP